VGFTRFHFGKHCECPFGNEDAVSLDHLHQK
jgi:hypothetical protein